MSSYQKENGIMETQDIDTTESVTLDAAFSILDDDQIDTCQRLVHNKPIIGHLSSKGDGSLMTVTLYRGKKLQIMNALINAFGSDYVKLWQKMSLSNSDNRVLAVPATQGTIMEGGFMQDYMVTGILVGYCKISRDHIEGSSSLDAFAKYGDEFITSLLKLHDSYDTKSIDATTYSFEVICQGRKGLFNDTHHMELAICYHRDRLLFLGASNSDTLDYQPHSTFNGQLLKHLGFEEPLWFSITEGKQINEMSQDMDDLIFKKMTKQEFLQKWPPSNYGFDQIAQVEDAIIDYEGWVFMKMKRNQWIYSKIKTVAYYKAHKFREDNIQYLLDLAAVQPYGQVDPCEFNVFPLAHKVAMIMDRATLNRRVKAICDTTVEMLDPTSSKYKALIAEIEESVVTSKAKNPISALDGKELDVQAKILINNPIVSFSAKLVPILREQFTEISDDTEDSELVPLIKGLIMKLEPFSVDVDSRIEQIDWTIQPAKNPTVFNKLIALYLN